MFPNKPIHKNTQKRVQLSLSLEPERPEIGIQSRISARKRDPEPGLRRSQQKAHQI